MTYVIVLERLQKWKIHGKTGWLRYYCRLAYNSKQLTEELGDLRTYSRVAYSRGQPVEELNEAKCDAEAFDADKLHDGGLSHGEEDTREAAEPHTESHHGPERVEQRQKLHVKTN